MNINEKFGHRIKEIRKAKGLSQEKLANLAEIDRTYLPEVERGERNISLVVAEKIANALGERLSQMLE
jgi:transcriptional regulator with XRE-family HTH domain